MLVWHIRPEQHTQRKSARTKSPDTDPLGFFIPKCSLTKNEIQPLSFTDNFMIPSITDSGKAMSKCGFEITLTSSEDVLVFCRQRQFVRETSV